MSWFFNKRSIKKDKLFLALDIGTESIKALIFSYNNNDKKIKVLADGLAYLEEYMKFSFTELENESLKKSISLAVNNAVSILESSEKRIKIKKKWQVFLGLPPNVLKAKVVSQSYLRSLPNKKISAREKDIISSDVLESAKKKISDNFLKNFGILSQDINWISLKIIESKIDGYLVPSIVGYEGKIVEFEIIGVFLPKNYWQSFDGIFNSLKLEIKEVVHLSEALPIFSKDRKDCGIFLDVGADITQIFVLKEGRIIHVDDFKSGGRLFNQTLSELWGLDRETIRTMIINYSKRLLTESAAKRIKEVFSPDKSAWAKSIKIHLKRIKNREAFPCFIFGGASQIPEIEESLKEIGDFDCRRTEVLSLKDFKTVEDENKRLNNPQYIPCLLISHIILK
ncbi:MAG: hypothetical protein PHI53_01665 [Candidatus Pacebacteria bacterium]|nr:hypothetical protein [Candidatus Paceibacterota bacterium]